MRRYSIANMFLILGFSCLLLSISFGLTASLQYLFPHFLVDQLSFQKTRPLHVFLAISWIFASVSGIMYKYISVFANRPLYSLKLAGIHFALQFTTILIVVSGFCLGYFSGREYLEFPPWVTIIIIVYWVLFAINFFATVNWKLSVSPVYYWMWCTGLIFFLITIVEAQLWLLPYFNNNIVRDVTVQWKANGSMVGAWNMLIYGSAMYAMEQITGDKNIGHQKKSFAFYFLGLTNLMFNWGHHTYIVPANPIIRQISYIISMTELVLLANIMITWSASFKKAPVAGYNLAYRFFRTADVWVLLNLVLAIGISIPYINQYTHGTQITVAHAMGATIGINTLLLMGCITFFCEKQLNAYSQKAINLGLKVIHFSLFFFWLSLIAAGITRSLALQQQNYFAQLSKRVLPYLKIFSISGFFLIIGICMVSLTYIRVFLSGKFHDQSGVG